MGNCDIGVRVASKARYRDCGRRGVRPKSRPGDSRAPADLAADGFEITHRHDESRVVTGIVAEPRENQFLLYRPVGYWPVDPPEGVEDDANVARRHVILPDDAASQVLVRHENYREAMYS